MGPRLRVLAVDDCADTADVLAVLLRLMGHEVRTANDGAGALAMAVADPPDVVILDLVLPTRSGLEVARALRLHSALKDVCLIALTGCSQDKHRRWALDAGFDHFLIKPVEPEVLEDLLASLTCWSPSRASGIKHGQEDSGSRPCEGEAPRWPGNSATSAWWDSG